MQKSTKLLNGAAGATVAMPDENANWGKYVGIGLEIAVGAVLGYFVGSWLDKRFGWNNYGALVGVMLGLAAGMYLLIKHAIRMNKD